MSAVVANRARPDRWPHDDAAAQPPPLPGVQPGRSARGFATRLAARGDGWRVLTPSQW